MRIAEKLLQLRSLLAYKVIIYLDQPLQAKPDSIREVKPLQIFKRQYSFAESKESVLIERCLLCLYETNSKRKARR